LSIATACIILEEILRAESLSFVLAYYRKYTVEVVLRAYNKYGSWEWSCGTIEGVIYGVVVARQWRE
jgi:hypothetical protein